MSDENRAIAEPLQVVLRLAEVFESLGIDYLVGGSLASSTLGCFRATQDVDMVVHITPTEIDELAGILQAEFYADADMMRAAWENRSAFNVIYLPTMIKADIFILPDTPFAQEQMRRRVLLPLFSSDTKPVYIATAEDIIVQKLLWYRMTGERSDRQWSDVQGVLVTQASNLDREYMRHWADQIGVADLLVTALEDARREST